MKIALFTDTFIPNINGIVTSILNSSKILAKKGHKLYIFTSEPKDKNFKKPNLGKNIFVFYYPITNIIKYPDFQLAVANPSNILSKIKMIQPDIIHIHTPSILGWEALIVAKMYKIPVVGTYHTLLPDFLKYLPMNVNKSDFAKQFTWGYTRNFYNMCDLVTTPSIAMKKELKKNGIKKVTFLSNGVDIEKFKKIKSKKNGNVILHVGRIGYEKNIDIILKAFHELFKTNKKVRLVIAGKGPALESLVSLSKQLGMSKNVEFLGAIDHDKLPRLYSSADVFVTASTVETEGLVILEAMASGLPIVGVNKLAIPYIVKNGRNGFLVKVGDYQKISESINKLLKNEKLRVNFGRESQKLVKDFSLGNIIKKLEKIYCSLI